MEPVSPEQWRHIDELMDAVLDGEAGSSTVSSGRFAAAPPHVRAEAERLLALRERLGPFLETPAAHIAPDVIAGMAAEHHDADRIPARLGPWRLLREIGRGGMATVYLAERVDPALQHRVAVKVMHASIATGSLVRRFIRERQILASLEHPGIARLLDGGVTDDGLPWFAMEYVDGEPISRYCERLELSIDQRLGLFLDVCAAVQYAHRNLVVHRDIKPSNILVTTPDPAGKPGRVKLLDFGIARLLAGDRSTNEPGLTRTGLLPLTPEYASPEQLRGEPVNTASDVYQLGVLLYELLTGRRPFPTGGLSLFDVQHLVLDTEPENPSAAIGRRDTARTADRGGWRRALRQRSASDHESLRRRLRGDLDTIVLKAIRKEPERRYASVQSLADDLRRHLRREPVSARPDTIPYRTSRFIRRHRIGVSAATLVFVLLSVLSASMAIQAGRLARERDRASHATAFLLDLFGALEPLQARGATVTVRDVLRRAVERAGSELADQPLLRASILDAIGEVYQLQGLHAEAEPVLEEALATRVAALGPGHLDVARSRNRLADLRYERGDYDSETLYRQALEIYATRLGDRSPEAVRARIGLALVLRARGNHTAADSILRHSLDHARADPGLSLDVPIILMFLGRLRTAAGEYHEAGRLIEESIALRHALLGNQHPAVANSYDALGELALAKDEAGEAEAHFRRALEIRQSLYDDGHTDLAAGYVYLARARHALGDPVAADTLVRKALPVFRRAFGENSPDVADALEHLGAARAALGDDVAADSLWNRALAIWRGMRLEPDHGRAATLVARLDRLRLRRSEPDTDPATHVLDSPQGHAR